MVISIENCYFLCENMVSKLRAHAFQITYRGTATTTAGNKESDVPRYNTNHFDVRVGKWLRRRDNNLRLAAGVVTELKTSYWYAYAFNSIEYRDVFLQYLFVLGDLPHKSIHKVNKLPTIMILIEIKNLFLLIISKIYIVVQMTLEFEPTPQS